MHKKTMKNDRINFLRHKNGHMNISIRVMSQVEPPNPCRKSSRVTSGSDQVEPSQVSDRDGHDTDTKYRYCRYLQVKGK